MCLDPVLERPIFPIKRKFKKKKKGFFELPVGNVLPFDYNELTTFGDLWRNPLWQWLEVGCGKPVFGV